MVSSGLKRASHVVSVFAGHGLGYFVHQFGLRWHLPFVDRLFAVRARQPDSVPVRLRLAMEALGGAYVKLGQLLALRPDLVPVEYCEEFKKLLDRAAPLPFSQVKKLVEQELHRPLDSLFSEFAAKPLGSASVAQVHRAKLKSGREVAVKLMRPGVEEQFSSDIEIMYYFARKIESGLNNKTFSPVTIVEEFDRYTRKELDFLVEARYLERFQKLFSAYSKVVVPAVHWRETSRRVLVMDFLDGVKLSDSLPRTVDKKALAQQVLDIALAQLFELGLFHADLHPGNIVVMPRGRIGLLDFGIVGELDERYSRLGLDLFASLVAGDSRRVSKILLETGVPSVETDFDAFQNDVESILAGWSDDGSVRTTAMMQRLFESCVHHKIKMPRDLVLLGKALVTVEGTALFLDPDFDFVGYAKPKLSLLRKRSLRFVARSALSKGKEFTETLWGLPKQTMVLMEHLSRDPIRVGIADSDVKHLGLDISMSSNRISYSLIISALIVAGALLSDVGPRIAGFSVVSASSFLAAGIILVPFLVSVWLEGRVRYDRHVEFR